VDRDEALTHLPEPYAVALRLRDAGVSDAQLAAGFGIEPESVQSFLKIAEVKLADLAREDR
jgi:DNA-directed RNA polymerase specialized sigma24 family protein